MYNFEKSKMKIPVERKRNIKLSLKDREEIAKLYTTGNYSQQDLADMFGVSKRLIYLYVDITGERLKKEKDLFKQRQKDGRYYHKDKQRIYVRNHRKYKRELAEKGLLVKDE